MSHFIVLFMQAENLTGITSESMKLLKIVSIPMSSSAESERCFSCNRYNYRR